MVTRLFKSLSRIFSNDDEVEEDSNPNTDLHPKTRPKPPKPDKTPIIHKISQATETQEDKDLDSKHVTLSLNRNVVKEGTNEENYVSEANSRVLSIDDGHGNKSPANCTKAKELKPLLIADRNLSSSSTPSPTLNEDETLDNFLSRVTSNLATNVRKPLVENHLSVPKSLHFLSMIPCEITRSGFLSENIASNISLSSALPLKASTQSTGTLDGSTGKSERVAYSISQIQEFVPRPTTTPAELSILSETHYGIEMSERRSSMKVRSDSPGLVKDFTIRSRSHSVDKVMKTKVDENLDKSSAGQLQSSQELPYEAPSTTPTPAARAKSVEILAHNMLQMHGAVPPLMTSNSSIPEVSSCPTATAQKSSKPKAKSSTTSPSGSLTPAAALTSATNTKSKKRSAKKLDDENNAKIPSSVDKSSAEIPQEVQKRKPPARKSCGEVTTSPAPSSQRSERLRTKSLEQIEAAIDEIIKEEGNDFREKYSVSVAKSIHEQFGALRSKLNKEFEDSYEKFKEENQKEIDELHEAYSEKMKIIEGSSEKFQNWMISLEDNHNDVLKEKDTEIEELRNQLQERDTHLSSALVQQRKILKADAEREKMDLITRHELNLQKMIDSMTTSNANISVLNKTVAMLKSELEAKTSKSQPSINRSGSKEVIPPTNAYRIEIDAAIQSLRATVTNLQARVKEMQQDKTKLEETHNGELLKLKRLHEADVTDLNYRLQKADEQLTTLKKKHAKEVKELKISMLNKETSYNRTFVELKRKYGEKIDSLTNLVNKIETKM